MWFPNRSDTNRAAQEKRMLDAGNLGFKKKRSCTIPVAKPNAQISFEVTAKLICCLWFRICGLLVFSYNENI